MVSVRPHSTSERHYDHCGGNGHHPIDRVTAPHWSFEPGNCKNTGPLIFLSITATPCRLATCTPHTPTLRCQSSGKTSDDCSYDQGENRNARCFNKWVPEWKRGNLDWEVYFLAVACSSLKGYLGLGSAGRSTKLYCRQPERLLQAGSPSKLFWGECPPFTVSKSVGSTVYRRALPKALLRQCPRRHVRQIDSAGLTFDVVSLTTKVLYFFWQ